MRGERVDRLRGAADREAQPSRTSLGPASAAESRALGEADDAREQAVRVRFWGVRGSYSVPGPSTVRFGGNTSCVEVSAGTQTVVFDAGTGIIGLGRDLIQRHGDRPGSVYIFLSHTHHDHIEGLRFFEPAYRPGWLCCIYGPGGHSLPLQERLAAAMSPAFFPVALSELPAHVSIHSLDGRNEVRVGSHRPAAGMVSVHCRAHPKLGVHLYRMQWNGRSLVYASDVEAPEGGREDVISLARGADLLIHDAQYTDAEYTRGDGGKAGWGHSTVRMAAEVARDAEVGQLVLYHHDPDHDDAQIRRLERQARSIFRNTQAAREGMVIELEGGEKRGLRTPD